MTQIFILPDGSEKYGHEAISVPVTYTRIKSGGPGASEAISEEVTDIMRFAPGWLEGATAAELAALGITVGDRAPTQAKLLTYAASKRYNVETGGCLFNGMLLATDRDSQVKVAGAVALAKANPNFTIADWKLAPGVYIDALDAAAIIAIGDALTAHVQACFSAERAIADAVMAGTIITFEQIEAASWPPNA